MNIYDARVQYTRKKIEACFLKLLNEKPVSRITVTELCNEAEINRATFYKHYRDIQDLLQAMEEDVLDQLQQFWDSQPEGDIEQMILQILQFTKTHGTRIFSLASKNGDPDFFAKIFLQSYHRAYPMLESNVQAVGPEQLKKIYRFVSHGSGSIMTAWFHEGMTMAPEDLAKLIVNLTSGAIQGVIQDNK